MKHYTLLLCLALLGAFPAAQAATGDTPASATAVSEGAPVAATININSASAEQLQGLKGIGPKTARAIVDWREQQGPFKAVDQLLAIKGIGEKTLARFRDQVTL
ncbi:ComEA family DNA-binding protein [Alloalcanivorax mobilis]|uniref:ComEA family DNA-binding protein n=1 Tax=Alloalcanivorax mobilis TaxID=2019569 RepID=UPI000B5B4619|nr:ComEA family DNA-binding protein [Alloalcanivorax mobilis]ASK34464.1 competence protein comEA [Alcanivorax sp. N3-2A]|tara:strand:- start:1919 stop:2230 length:312 start_codon:yes stop_codon:yes gene_type:complete